MRRLDFVLEPFRQASNARATWQLLTTLAPVAGLWVVVAWIGQAQLEPVRRVVALLPVLALLVLFSARTFSLMHDCGHDSLFRSRWLNRLVGFWLGVLNAIPQHPWSRGHAFHHRHNGNWDRYRGPSALVTLEHYSQLTRQQRWLYGLLRQPLMLLPGGFFYLVIKPRLALLLGSVEFVIATARSLGAAVMARGWRGLMELPALVRQHRSSHWYTSGELADLIANNVLVLTSWVLMSRQRSGSSCNRASPSSTAAAGPATRGQRPSRPTTVKTAASSSCREADRFRRISRLFARKGGIGVAPEPGGRSDRPAS